MIRPISDAITEITKRYGGLLWSEHGWDCCGEYSPLHFEPDFYPG